MCADIGYLKGLWKKNKEEQREREKYLFSKCRLKVNPAIWLFDPNDDLWAHPFLDNGWILSPLDEFTPMQMFFFFIHLICSKIRLNLSVLL